MRATLSFFKMRFLYGLQYRSAAYAGIATQFAWGFMYIMLYKVLYEGNPEAVSMGFSQLATYLWLQQAFLALFMTWFLENDLFDMITDGNVAYELCRPMNLYNMWFAKNCATRVSKAVLRCFPILMIAFLLPKPYNLSLPYSGEAFGLFLISMILSLIVVVAYCMMIYILTFYTVSPIGVRMIFIMLADFLSGGLVPIPLLPDWLVRYINLSPFAAMQNIPFRIYSGHISGVYAYEALVMQIIWSILLIGIGYLMMNKALRKVTVQGG